MAQLYTLNLILQLKKKMPLRDHHLQLIIAGNNKGGGRGRGRETILVTNFRLSLNPIKI